MRPPGPDAFGDFWHPLARRRRKARKSLTLRAIFWCGEGDLNPHEIAPASTSRYLTGFPEVARNLILLILHGAVLPGVSWGIANTVAEPLQFHASHLGAVAAAVIQIPGS